jgi:hypothetical protein
VARDGIEPPLAFSGLDSVRLNPFSVNRWIGQAPLIVTIL